MIQILCMLGMFTFGQVGMPIAEAEPPYTTIHIDNQYEIIELNHKNYPVKPIIKFKDGKWIIILRPKSN